MIIYSNFRLNNHSSKITPSSAFFSFRFFDVLKPPPIRDIDRRCKGGFGVMADDIAAAAYSLISMAIVSTLLNLWRAW